MRKMWRNRETNKNEILAGLCLLFAIGGIMLAGFGTKDGDITAVTLGDGTRYVEADEGQGEYVAGETPQMTQAEQGQTTQAESEQATSQEQTASHAQTAQEEPEQAASQEQAAQEEPKQAASHAQPTQENQEQTISKEQTAQENQEQVILKEQTAQSEEKPATPATGDLDDTVVVQAGDSLWKIAERYLGDGSQYIAIYNQNRELIGDDPRLILSGIELNLDGLELAAMEQEN
ncbi:MAG: LysM peptidoglycan-binding domain-containing protein [Muribaculum sp.]|nr:LysM peptidoglycan-binding domain-containing protein [Muribaculum sp.]